MVRSMTAIRVWVTWLLRTILEAGTQDTGPGFGITCVGKMHVSSGLEFWDISVQFLNEYSNHPSDSYVFSQVGLLVLQELWPPLHVSSFLRHTWNLHVWKIHTRSDFTVTLPAPVTQQCGPGWAYDGMSNACFMLNHELLTWNAALERCREVGGDLASITGNNDQSFITALISTIGMSPSYWVGGNDIDPSSGWKWTDGSPFPFFYWADGEYRSIPHSVSGLRIIEHNS